MEDEELHRLFTALGGRAALPIPSDAEVIAALDLARVVAHGSVRRGAPLVCYAAGLAMGAAMDPAERAARLAALVAEVEAMAADAAAPAADPAAPPAEDGAGA
jgi:DNA-binding IclR family transcriptional regulator